MKFFTKKEKKIILLILVCLFTIVGINMKVSLRRGRDNTRKNDLSVLQKALDIFISKYQMFPPSVDGKIEGCFGPDTKVDQKQEN